MCAALGHFCPPGCGNSISVRAFLEEGDDGSLEEIKNQQDVARSAPLPGGDRAPSEHRTSPTGSGNGLCGPLSGRERPEAPSPEGALLSPISVLAAEIDKLSLQGLGSRVPKTPNRSVDAGGPTLPAPGVDAVGGASLGAPEASGLGSQQTRTRGGESVGTVQLHPPPGRSSVSPASRAPVHRRFLSG